MLQQTQVDRVVPYFERWMRVFPTIESLGRAPLAKVLREWSGLGYNRRAKLLRECAKEIVGKHGGKVPKDFAALKALPGIGPYTASAVRVFAFNQPDVLIETNIRSAFLHHIFPHTRNVDDRRICVYAKKAAKGQNPRTWNAALMDYGSFLKKTHPNPSRRSKHHIRQSPFEGSVRKVRGAILRKLLDGPISKKALLKIDVKSSYQMEKALRDLLDEGLIQKTGSTWMLSD